MCRFRLDLRFSDLAIWRNPGTYLPGRVSLGSLSMSCLKCGSYPRPTSFLKSCTTLRFEMRLCCEGKRRMCLKGFVPKFEPKSTVRDADFRCPQFWPRGRNYSRRAL